MFLTPFLIIDGYKKGIFPMAESIDDPFIFWVSPEIRGLIELKNFKIPRSLKKFIKKNPFKIKINENFIKVIKKCGSLSKKRKDTWINEQIIQGYTRLFEDGLATSIECYDGLDLVGGLYGVQLGKFFFGESMFSYKPNASKISLVYLAAYLKQGGFNFIDTQFQTNHLKQFGAIEIKKDIYMKLLKKNITKNANMPKTLNKNVLDYFN